MDIKLETLRYHLVIFWRDFFTIDFYCKSGPFVMQNRYTSFPCLMSAVFSSSEQKAHSDQAIGIVECLSCVVPHVANNFFKGHLPKLKPTF